MCSTGVTGSVRVPADCAAPIVPLWPRVAFDAPVPLRTTSYSTHVVELAIVSDGELPPMWLKIHDVPAAAIRMIHPSDAARVASSTSWAVADCFARTNADKLDPAP